MHTPYTTVHEEGGLYRSRKGIFLGICKGLAEWRNFAVFWTRALVIIALIVTGFWPVLFAYLILGLILKPEPVIQLNSVSEKEFYDSYSHSRKQALQRLKTTFDQLDRRTQRLEDRVVSSDFKWQQQMGRK